MKFLCDTSVIVAATIEEHEHHQRSLRLMDTMPRKQRAFLASHSLSEAYATLTSAAYKLSPQTLEEDFLKRISSHFTFVALSHTDYLRAFKRVASGGFVSGIIYDALILECALKVKAEILYTWNSKHFLRFQEPGIKILSP
ncbi:MAG: PIN domain-containing protein [Deltaproteobacteria bacterium]|nr:MAG: PIN domain-containing protein [Deltaproteobacteria bacterium]